MSDLLDKPMKLILGSASPRRKELVAMLGLPFTIEKPEIEEVQQEGEAPAEFAKRLSREKAAAIATNHEPAEGFVISADTIVVHYGEVLGKPQDEDDARQMLKRLRGESHRVLTAVTIQNSATGKVITDICDSKVTLRQMSDDEIEAYVATGDPLDKAAAYAIQNVQYAPVEQVVGCPANVMGLPMCHVVRSLRRHGVELPASDPTQCRYSYGGYYCEIAEAVMPGLTEKAALTPPSPPLPIIGEGGARTKPLG